jgi:hypothetical protein
MKNTPFSNSEENKETQKKNIFSLEFSKLGVVNKSVASLNSSCSAAHN